MIFFCYLVTNLNANLKFMSKYRTGSLFANRYVLTELIGIGGFSEVWKAQDSRADELIVALKIYCPERGMDQHGIEIFKKEYALTQPLNHPNLLKSSYFDIEGGSPYLIMPYCGAGSLARVLHKEGKLEEGEIALILRDICEGLSYLHQQQPPILHQDIKPDNILLADDGRYMLSDFGISSKMRSTMRKATSNMVSLSLAYSAPERFSGNPVSLPASDIFSLGTLLYELCTGDVPWMGNGGMVLLSGAELPHLPGGNFPPELNQLIRSCMNPRPEKRPQAAQLLAVAKAYLATGHWEEVSSPPISLAGPEPLEQPGEEPSLSPEPQEGRKTTRIPLVPQPVVPQETGLQKQNRPQIVIQARNGEHTLSLSPRIKPTNKKLLLTLGLAAVVLLSLGLGGFAFYHKKKREQYQADMAKGQAFLQDARYDSALHYYAAANTLFPKDAAARHEHEKLVLLQQALQHFYSANYQEAYELFEEAAEYESGDANYYLGELTFNGLGTSKDTARGMAFTRLAVDQGFGMAYWRLGSNYDNGIGVEADTSQAKAYYRKALPVLQRLAELGDPEAQGNLGAMYSMGDVVKRDDEEAMKWYLRAAEQGYAFVQVNLGAQYHSEEKFGKAYEWFEKAAEAGDARGEFMLGLMYYQGDSLAKNTSRARQYFELAAEKDYVDAQLYLGIIAYNEKDYAAAVPYFLKAAEQEYLGAYTFLSAIYKRGGYGVEKDIPEAIKWYTRAGEQGHADSWNQLGVMYANGDGVNSDFGTAAGYFRKAINAGGNNTMYKNLAYLYREGGPGLSQNLEQAKRYYKIAGNRGDGEASYWVGLIYAEEQDAYHAGIWFKKAMRQGHEEARVMYVVGAERGYWD